jgi:hypothetical protein
MRYITNILKKLAGPLQSVPTGAHVTIRHALPSDAEALVVLAKLDSSHPPHGASLVAEVGGELWAAISVDDGHVIATPFRPSGELAFRLIERASELRRVERRRTRRAANGWRPPEPLGGSR